MKPSFTKSKIGGGLATTRNRQSLKQLAPVGKLRFDVEVPTPKAQSRRKTLVKSKQSDYETSSKGDTKQGKQTCPEKFPAHRASLNQLIASFSSRPSIFG